MKARFNLVLMVMAIAGGLFAQEPETREEQVSPAVRLRISDEEETEDVRVSRNLQPPAPLTPPTTQQPAVASPRAAQDFSRGLQQSQATVARTPATAAFSTPFAASLGRSAGGAPISVSGAEGVGRASSDAGGLLGSSPSATGVSVQRRTPIVNDPRIHGSRVGSLAAAGSYWVPARIDLDTPISKFDSRILQEINAIPGPFSVLDGPGFDFLLAETKRSPRFQNGFEMHGASAFDFKTNGEQFHGRQEAWGGDEVWGFSVGYSHRTGNDYVSGDGTPMPSSYNSREFNVALGAQVTSSTNVEFSYLRLDQTGVEFPGQAFDINALKTDGFDLRVETEDSLWGDRLVMEGWFNETSFNGDAQQPGKRLQFPIYDFINFVGFTDVDSTSAGFRWQSVWEEEDREWIVGTDLRNVQQELQEITSGRIGFNVWNNANSPIPLSAHTNPGIFARHKTRFSESFEFTVGGRVDGVFASPLNDVNQLTNVGTQGLPYSFIVGTNDFHRQFGLIGGYVNSRLYMQETVWLDVGLGHGERAPNLTELYAAESFMFLIQNGLNTVTGDPGLDPERRWELNTAVNAEGETWRARARGFYALVQDYITFESMSVYQAPPGGINDQINLKYVNTDLATLIGTDLQFEVDATPMLTPFATLQFVQGDDRTRNGDFATLQAGGGLPSQRVLGFPRGFFSGIPGAAQEPLPGIAPLESRLGIRWHQSRVWEESPPWSIEFSTRIVGPQNRVASSLGETRTGGFTVFDLRGKWQPQKHCTLIGGVENLTDLNYREHLDFRSARGFGMLQPGINFYAGTVVEY